MARIGITITKSCVFRDSVQEFNNTYYYGSLDALPSESDALSLITEVVNGERPLHSTAVTFVKGKLWKADGTPQQNHMIREENLTGPGTALSSTSIDRERAYLIQWAAGVDSRGHPVHLKKWYHTCGTIPGSTISTGVLSNMSGFSIVERNAIAAQADALTRIGVAEQWGLVAKSGRERDGGMPVAHRYLEHHQLGDQWR